jgi:hypothetical protein
MVSAVEPRVRRPLHNAKQAERPLRSSFDRAQDAPLAITIG